MVIDDSLSWSQAAGENDKVLVSCSNPQRHRAQDKSQDK